jgi:CRISPR/Cas system-associated endoribonuclease Cas2
MSQFGYFTEIEMLQKRIKELELKLEEERTEHRDIFLRMRAQCMQNSNNEYELKCSREENAMLKAELQEIKSAQIIQAAIRRVITA